MPKHDNPPVDKNLRKDRDYGPDRFLRLNYGSEFNSSLSGSANTKIGMKLLGIGTWVVHRN